MSARHVITRRSASHIYLPGIGGATGQIPETKEPGNKTQKEKQPPSQRWVETIWSTRFAQL